MSDGQKSGGLSRRTMLKALGATAGVAALQGAGMGLWPGKALAAEPGSVEYREIPRVGMRLSTVGIGAGNLKDTAPSEVDRLMGMAVDQGINFLDMLLPYGDFPQVKTLARAVCRKRDKMHVQMHIGALFRRGQYTRSRSVRLIQKELEQELADFGGYFDIGLIHYVDKRDDFKEVVNDGMLDYAVKLKKAGKIRALGFSSHSTDIAREFLKLGVFDVYMFSVNPSYDFDVVDGHLVPDKDRMALYQETAKLGVGIVCMKTYGGSRLLDAKNSKLGRAMTPAQCIQYCLDRPAVVSCPVGMRSVEEFKSAVAYYGASRQERDYSFLGTLQKKDMTGNCVYCNHCLPCPANIDIGLATKFYDLALTGDELAKDHYRRLAKSAQDCIYCGKCEPNCPFNVPIMEMMKKMTAYFGKA